jgi:hypothetical protein
MIIAEALYSGCKVVCYKLPHYEGFFGKFPEYILLGDKNAFARKYNIKRDLKKQKQFTKKFDSDKLIKKESKEILNLNDK